jgi:pyruvate formate lyase activating enzyme
MTGSPTRAARAGTPKAATPAAVIFDIQRLALDDGPGIRTNVFFKGCPLDCQWCHNPESISPAPELSFTAALCRGCRRCVEACTHGVHGFVDVDGGVRHLVDHARCAACGACVRACCDDALALAGREYSVDELLKEIETDRPYYAIGEGGGVTLTGGEPMLQAAFVAALLERLDGVHVCLETCGHASADDFRAIAPKLDLVLFDYKATDPETHRRLCGVDNALILANLDLLCSMGCRVALRLPLVPGVNDDDGHLRAIADLLRRYPAIEYAQLMPYHDLGASKAERFGVPTRMTGLPTATAGQKAAWLARLEARGARNVRL